jgi:hypothetical protein
LDFGPIFKIMPRGGHFPALEQPTLWMDGWITFARSCTTGVEATSSERQREIFRHASQLAL